MFKTDAEFDAAKDALMEKWVLHKLYPNEYSAPEIATFEDIVILMAKDRRDMVSKMAVYKWEQKALNKLRVGLKKFNINSLSDVLDTGRYRKAGTIQGSAEYDMPTI